jgi:hypothetical protein
MWEPRRLTTLWAFTVCYRDSFTSARTEDENAVFGQNADLFKYKAGGIFSYHCGQSITFKDGLSIHIMYHPMIQDNWWTGNNLVGSCRTPSRHQSEIRTEHLSKMCREPYRCANPLAHKGVKTLKGPEIASWPRILKKKGKVVPVTDRVGP